MTMFARAQARIGVALAALENRLIEIRGNEDGQAMVEYGLILALVAVVAVVALQVVGVNVVGELNKAIDVVK